MEKVANFFKALGESADVIAQFPVWLKVLSFCSAFYLLVFGGLFIYQYAKHAALLKQSSALSALEKRALSGEPQAMIELSFSNSPKAFDILSTLLRSSPQEEVRQNAANALANLQDRRKTQVLGGTLVSEKWLVAGTCAQALGRSGDPAAVPYLLRALELRIDWVVAQKSAEALGNFPPTNEILQALVTAMNEGDSFEQEAAKQSLVKFGEVSLPWLLRNTTATDSVDALSHTIHAIRIVGTNDPTAAVASLRQLRDRLPRLEMKDESRQRLISEIDAAINTLQHSAPINTAGK